MQQFSTDTSLDVSTMQTIPNYEGAETSMMQPTRSNLEFDKSYYDDKYDPGKVEVIKHKMRVSQRANQPKIEKAINRQKKASLRLRVIN